MSIEKTSSGAWRVRWRVGGVNRSKVCGSKRDAEAFEGELVRAKRMGTLAHLEMGTDLFGDFAETYFCDHVNTLAPKTQILYGYLLDKYLEPRFGLMMLASITRAEIDAWMGDLNRQEVGPVARQKALSLLSAILTRAVEHDKLARNPALTVKKPKHKRKAIDPPTPLTVERIRDALIARKRLGEATLVSVLAYAGLRPQEALALQWIDIQDKTLRVGDEHKTGSRSVDLMGPLAADLAQWKLVSQRDLSLVFPNTRGKQWSESGWSNWRRRVWHGTEDKPGVAPEGMTPYALRHAFCSLLIRDDKLSLMEQADQAGHSVVVHLRDYGHLFRELKGKGSAEDAIREARQQVAKERAA